MTEPESQDSAAPPTARAGSVLDGVILLGGGAILGRAIAFVGTAYVARVLGPEGFGILGFATAVCGYLALAVSAGFQGAGAWEVAKRPNDVAEITWSVITVRLALAVLAMTSLIGVSLVLDKPPTFRLVLVLSGLTFFSSAFDSSWAWKGLEQNGRVALANVLSQVVYLGIVVTVVHGASSVSLVPLAQFAGDLVGAAVLALFLIRFGAPRVRVSEGLAILRSSSPLFLTRLLRTLLFSFDVVLLGLLLGAREVGIYNAPYRIVFLILAISGAVQMSYLPTITRASAAGPKELAAASRRSFALTVAIGMPIAAGGALLAPQLLELLFGPSYAEGASALRLLLLSIAMIFFNSVAHNVLLVSGRFTVETRIMALAASTNIALNLLWIPRYGIVGAATATAISSGILFLVGVFALGRLGIGLGFGGLARPLFAAGAMTAGIMAVGMDRPPVALVALGAVLYPIALILVKGIPEDALPRLESLSSSLANLGQRGR